MGKEDIFIGEGGREGIEHQQVKPVLKTSYRYQTYHFSLKPGFISIKNRFYLCLELVCLLSSSCRDVGPRRR